MPLLSATWSQAPGFQKPKFSQPFDNTTATHFFLVTSAPAMAQQTAKMSEDEAFALGVEAYIYGYPLVTMEMTRRVMTNVAEPKGTRGPMGQFVKMREYPTAAFKDVTAPNADTLYTVAWLDLSKEPWVMSLPDMTQVGVNW